LAALLCTASAFGAPEDLNGNWTVDEAHSEDLESAGRAFNKARNAEKRSKQKQEFDRSSDGNRTRNKYQAAADATEKMIREDYRSHGWTIADEARPLVEAEAIKLYVARKVAVLYDGDTRRLLTINPGGRAFSVKGQEITHDPLGAALTYFEDDALVIETDLVAGGKLVERYALGPDSNRLIQTLRLQDDARGPWLEFAREYVRAE
jgi:hypothetical protein